MRGRTRLGILLSAVLALVATNHVDVAAQQCPKGKLRIYTSWPMQGAMIPEGTGMKNGLDMAFAEVGGVVAGFCVEIINLDDASPQTGKWDGAVEAENANKAVADPLAILYVGTYNSGAAKVSIPINNRAHMAHLQFHAYGGADWHSMRSEAAAIAVDSELGEESARRRLPSQTLRAGMTIGTSAGSPIDTCVPGGRCLIRSSRRVSKTAPARAKFTISWG